MKSFHHSLPLPLMKRKNPSLGSQLLFTSRNRISSYSSNMIFSTQHQLLLPISSSSSRAYISSLPSRKPLVRENSNDVTRPSRRYNLNVTQRTFAMSYWQKFKSLVEGYQQSNVFKRGTEMYNSCQEQAFHPDWFTKGRVVADFRGKLILVTLHVWLVNRRLLKLQEINPATLRLQESLFDEMWEYSAATIKSLQVYRQQKSLESAQYFAFYICNDLDEALGGMEEETIIDEFGGIIWNKLYRREDLPEDHVMEVARYLYREYKNIDRLTDDEFLSTTKFPWGPVPEFKDINKKVRAGKGHPNRLWPDEENENNQNEGASLGA